MFHKALFLSVFLGFLALSASAQLKVEKYTNYTLEGFNVLVEDNAFVSDSTRTEQGVKLLESKLLEITQLGLSQLVMDSLRAVPIFMDWNTTTGAAVYHPGRQWLLDNGYIPQKAKCIEISNINNFINWTGQNQPMMVLHELTHARHHRVFNFNNTELLMAFENAVESNLYTNVSYHRGNEKYETVAKAYALNNQMEYLAEITEAYFGTNDFYPFNRFELRQYDPIGYQAVESIWGTTSASVVAPLSASSVLLYPNPAFQQVMVEHGSTKSVNLEIHTLDGRFVKHIEGHQSGAPMDITDLTKGTYLLTVVEEGKLSSILLVKQ